MSDRNEAHSPRVTDEDDRNQIPSNRMEFLAPSPIWRHRPPIVGKGLIYSISTQIIPQIGFALRSMSFANTASLVKIAAPTEPFEVQQFTRLVLGTDETATRAFVENLIAKGAPTDLIFLNLLAPSAQLLGEMWEADTTDFANVTLAVSHLQRILRHLGESYLVVEEAPRSGAALLTTTSGEQHSFGLAMVAELFRHGGWDICTGPFASHHEMSSMVADRWFDVVGFSVTSDRRLDELKRDIHDVRRDSRNRHIGIILGGPMMLNHPELVSSLGADISSTDGATAPQLARELVQRLTRQD
jgi:methanogenic corrinoid protein MtbC1